MKDKVQLAMAIKLVHNKHPLSTLELEQVIPSIKYINWLWRDQAWEPFERYEAASGERAPIFDRKSQQK